MQVCLRPSCKGRDGRESNSIGFSRDCRVTHFSNTKVFQMASRGGNKHCLLVCIIPPILPLLYLGTRVGLCPFSIVMWQVSLWGDCSGRQNDSGKWDCCWPSWGQQSTGKLCCWKHTAAADSRDSAVVKKATQEALIPGKHTEGPASLVWLCIAVIPEFSIKSLRLAWGT